MKWNSLLRCSLLVTVFFTSTLKSQSLSAKLLDSATTKPIPFATVQLGNKGIITNDEGEFTFILDNKVAPTDSLHISCIGYQTVSKPIEAFTSTTIYLSPKAIELREVIVSNKNYTADEIIDFVEDRLEENYDTGFTKKRVFHRQSSFNRWLQSDFTVTESSIPVLNQRFLDSVIQTVPKYDSYYSEVLGDFYGDDDPDTQKLQLLKASKLYDKATELDYDKLDKKFNDILKENVTKGSFFKVKTGIVGFKIDEEDVDELFKEPIDSTDTAALNAALAEKKKNKEEEQENYANWKKRKLTAILTGLPTAEDTDLDFISKSRKYEYTLKEFTFLGDDAVYVVDFFSKGSADYKGTLHIHADSFAVLQVQYENIKPLRDFKLLGIAVNNYVSKGKIIYDKGTSGYYGLRYYESESATRTGIKRGLKIIEKNRIVKGRNKQNELAGKMDFAFNSVEKHEVVVFETNTVSQSDFDAVLENKDILPEYMEKYNPAFWDGYAILEPNSAIKSFASKAKEEEQ